MVVDDVMNREVKEHAIQFLVSRNLLFGHYDFLLETSLHRPNTRNQALLRYEYSMSLL